MTRESLLQAILAYSPYNEWIKTGNGRLGVLGEYREKKKDGTSAVKLDALGLYSFSENKAISSLWQLGKDLGIPGAESVARSKEKKTEVIDAARGKKTKQIIARMNDKVQWKADFYAVLLPYFQGQRQIPFPSDREAFKFFREIKATVARWKDKDTNKAKTEIVIPLLSSEGQLVQTLRIEVDENDGCKKIGKKLWGPADRDRAIVWGRHTANEIILFEGLEDAMSLWFSMADAMAGSNIAVSCGAGGYSHLASITEVYGSRVVICDNDSNGAGLKASEVLGDGWLRVLPDCGESGGGVDCNASLLSGGVPAVREWFDGLQRINSADFAQVLDNAEAEEIELAQTATFLYHYGKNPWTDAGTVQAFIAMWGNQVRVTEDGSWWTWNGRVWRRGSALGPVGRKIAALSPVYEKLARMYLKKHKNKEEKCVEAVACNDWAEKLASSHTQRGVVAMLHCAEELQCNMEDFDARPELLNVQNGILNFKSCKLEPHTPEAMCSRICNVSWDPKATCETWDGFIKDITEGDVALEAYKYRQHGYLASGDTSEKVFFFHLGPKTNNGKTVEAETLQWLMGDYVKTVDPDMFLENKFGGLGGSAEYQLARLPGVRLAICGETDEKRAWSEAAVKRFTSDGDRIVARHIRQSPFEFVPRFKAIIHGNHKPKLQSGSKSFMGRIHLIPYEFVPPVLDRDLKAKLKLEGSGILNKIFWGYYEWKEIGLRPPQCVLEAMEQYQSEAFPDVEEFVDACCITNGAPETKEGATELWRAYEAWNTAKNRRGDAKSQTVFGRELERLGYDSQKQRCGDRRGNKQKIFRLGIQLATQDIGGGSERFKGEFDD